MNCNKNVYYNCSNKNVQHLCIQSDRIVRVKNHDPQEFLQIAREDAKDVQFTERQRKILGATDYQVISNPNPSLLPSFL